MRVGVSTAFDVDAVAAFVDGINVDANVGFDDRLATPEFVVVVCAFVGNVDVGNVYVLCALLHIFLVRPYGIY